MEILQEKDYTRKLLNPNQIKKNIQSIKKVFNKILVSKNNKTKPIFVNNAEWLTKLKYIQFLRDIEVILQLIKC